LGALRHDGQLIWTTRQWPTTREDVIAFLDQIADQPHSVPRIVLFDNAAIHKGDIMDKQRHPVGQARAVFLLFAAIQLRAQSH
jgi:hypothetical protein